jgi:hypothetical protein
MEDSFILNYCMRGENGQETFHRFRCPKTGHPLVTSPPTRQNLANVSSDPGFRGERAAPEPGDSLFDVDSQRSVMFANADGPKAAELFEMPGRMAGIRLKEGEVPIGQRSNFRG